MSTQSSSTKIRKATLKDAQAIAEPGTHVFTVTLGPDFPPADLQTYLSENYSTSAIAIEIENPDKDMLVATSRGPPEPRIKNIPNQVQLQRLYIHPSAQGQGVGKMLVARVEEEAKKQEFENLWLGVYEKNQRAIGVYERLGFERVGTHEFVTGNEVQMDLIMLKSL
jgi:ribosomal protein S18 acetylase RimI-like enzyme